MRYSHSVWPWLSASAAIAVLIGAGTSFAPLYLDNWGGTANHYMCPVIGGHSVDDPQGDAGLCVSPLPWFATVSLLCLMLAVVFAVYCEMAVRLDVAGGVRAGGVMSRSARRARNAMFWTLPAFLAVGIALAVLTGAVWLPLVWAVAFAVVWLQATWHVCDRIGLSLATRTANDTLAAVWGFGVALITHALVCFHVTFGGGMVGAVLAACCSWAIATVTDGDVDASGELAATDRRISTARGVVAFIIQWMMAYNAIRSLQESSTVATRTGTRLCPQFSVDGSGQRIASCSPDGLLPALSTTGLIVAVVALPLGVCAAMACHVGKRALARTLYALTGLCTASAFVIGVTLA